MGVDEKLQFVAQSLIDEIEGILRGAADVHPYLDGASRALKRMSKAADRPLRVGILGQANSGKSSLANLLAGVPVVPVPSLPHARMPVLLTYAPKPSAAAVYNNGERVDFPLLQDVTRAVAALQDSAAISSLLAGKCIRSGGVKFLEAGLPSSILRSIEILDFPAGSLGLRGYGVDAAIWTTVASRAWCESERAPWAKLPHSVRSRSLLAVTFCDVAAGKESDLKLLRDRLETSARPYFQGICFVSNGNLDPAAAASRNQALFAQVQFLAQHFSAERFGKAMAVAHRAVAKASAKHGTALEHSGLRSHAAVADILPSQKPPLPEIRLAKPAILLTGHANGTPAGTGARGTAPAVSRVQRPRWRAIGAAAAAMAAVAALVAIQPGLIGTGQNTVSNPLPAFSEAVVQSTKETTEPPRIAELQDNAATAQRATQAETAALEKREISAQETAEAVENGMAPAEAAMAGPRGTDATEMAAAGERRNTQADPEGRRKADASRRRRAGPEEAERHARVVAVAARRQFSSIVPIMHGVSQ